MRPPRAPSIFSRVLHFFLAAAPSVSSWESLNFIERHWMRHYRFFQATSHTLDQSGLVTCRPANPQNKGQACFGSFCLSWALLGGNSHNRGIKSHLVGPECPYTECCWWVMCFYHPQCFKLVVSYVVRPLLPLLAAVNHKYHSAFFPSALQSTQPALFCPQKMKWTRAPQLVAVHFPFWCISSKENGPYVINQSKASLIPSVCVLL